jgi:hypothetical protein
VRTLGELVGARFLVGRHECGLSWGPRSRAGFRCNRRDHRAKNAAEMSRARCDQQPSDSVTRGNLGMVSSCAAARATHDIRFRPGGC